MRGIVRALLVIAMPVVAFAVNYPKPLLSNVMTIRRGILSIKVTDAGLQYAYETGPSTHRVIEWRPVVDGAVCVPGTTSEAGLDELNPALEDLGRRHAS